MAPCCTAGSVGCLQCPEDRAAGARADVHALSWIRAHLCVGPAREDAIAKAHRIATFEAEGGVLLPIPVISHGHLACEHCSLRFASRANLAAHMSTVHGKKAAVNVASGSCCSVCQVEWWTAYRLREHLRPSPACLQAYEVADLDASADFETTGNRAQKAWRAPTQSYGPQPWWATLTPAAPEVRVSATGEDVACRSCSRWSNS